MEDTTHMTSTIKNELWEMGHNKFFLISLLVGTLIVCVDMLQNFATLMKWYTPYKCAMLATAIMRTLPAIRSP